MAYFANTGPRLAITQRVSSGRPGTQRLVLARRRVIPNGLVEKGGSLPPVVGQIFPRGKD